MLNYFLLRCIILRENLEYSIAIAIIIVEAKQTQCNLDLHPPCWPYSNQVVAKTRPHAVWRHRWTKIAVVSVSE